MAPYKVVRNHRVRLNIKCKQVEVPISAEQSAHFTNLFRREKPSDIQRRRMQTLKSLMATAYLAGKDS
jgi:hypothetical protein